MSARAINRARMPPGSLRSKSVSPFAKNLSGSRTNGLLRLKKNRSRKHWWLLKRNSWQPFGVLPCIPRRGLIYHAHLAGWLSRIYRGQCMIILKHLKVKRVRLLRNVDLYFPQRGSILISGPNEAGKSTIFESIYFALYGEPLGYAKRAAPSLNELIHYGEKRTIITLALAIG